MLQTELLGGIVGMLMIERTHTHTRLMLRLVLSGRVLTGRYDLGTSMISNEELTAVCCWEYTSDTPAVQQMQ